MEIDLFSPVRYQAQCAQSRAEEEGGGHGMLSVIFVQANSPMMPGPDFFMFAKDKVGRQFDERIEFWVGEHKQVVNSWKKC